MTSSAAARKRVRVCVDLTPRKPDGPGGSLVAPRRLLRFRATILRSSREPTQKRVFFSLLFRGDGPNNINNIVCLPSVPANFAFNPPPPQRREHAGRPRRSSPARKRHWSRRRRGEPWRPICKKCIVFCFFLQLFYSYLVNLDYTYHNKFGIKNSILFRIL